MPRVFAGTDLPYTPMVLPLVAVVLPNTPVPVVLELSPTRPREAAAVTVEYKPAVTPGEPVIVIWSLGWGVVVPTRTLPAVEETLLLPSRVQGDAPVAPVGPVTPCVP